MTNNPSSKPPVGFLDNPHAPEVFVDECTGFFVFNGCVRLTFESARVNHVTSPGPVNRVVVGRIVMPVGAAERLRDFLIESLKRDSPPNQVAGPATIQ